MTQLNNKWILAAVTFVILFGLQTPASAVPLVVNIVEDPGIPQDVNALTGFTTTGSDMAGMIVTAFFQNEEEIMAVWMAGAPGNGFATTSVVSTKDPLLTLSFSLTQTGDTFTQPWSLRNLTTRTGGTEMGLTRLVIDGIAGETVFDLTNGGAEGTPGSSFGHDFSGSYIFPLSADAVYLDEVRVGGAPAGGDIYGSLDIRLSGSGLVPLAFGDEVLVFVADTDSVGLFPPGQAPEPGSTLLLLGAGLIALYRRRRG